jgi:hypothetical protein
LGASAAAAAGAGAGGLGHYPGRSISPRRTRRTRRKNNTILPQRLHPSGARARPHRTLNYPASSEVQLPVLGLLLQCAVRRYQQAMMPEQCERSRKHALPVCRDIYAIVAVEAALRLQAEASFPHRPLHDLWCGVALAELGSKIPAGIVEDVQTAVVDGYRHADGSEAEAVARGAVNGSGWVTNPASRVTRIVDVVEARIASSRIVAQAKANAWALASMTSGTPSKTLSHCASAGLASSANTCAMPRPIRPAPMVPMTGS